MVATGALFGGSQERLPHETRRHPEAVSKQLIHNGPYLGDVPRPLRGQENAERPDDAHAQSRCHATTRSSAAG
jgi:hypothetical protein